MERLKIIEDSDSSFWLFLMWEGELWKKVYKSLFIGKLRSLFSARNFQEVEDLFLELEVKVAKAFAVRTLSKRALLSAELGKKLREKGISERASQETLSYCQQMGAIQDQELLEYRIGKELRKGHGLRYIQAKWKVEIGLEDKRNAEKEAALKLLQQKGKKQKNPYLFLQRRGFCLDTIQEVLRDFF